jgi:choline dehydrogenase-like flavoprotein
MKHFALTVTLAALASAASAREAALTCDAERLEPRSYRLTTTAVALATTQPRHSWWDSFDLGKHADDLADLNWGVTRAAERALELDPRNRMGHSILARQYLILEDPERAEAAWRAVLDGGGAVVWTSTYYDVDARDFFFTAVDRNGLRIYQWSQIANSEKRRFGGVLEFPGPEDERFWRAGGGCFEPGLAPHAQVAWSDVREIKAGNWVLWFKLARPVSVTSDRNNKRKTLDELRVGLHGRTGELEVYKPVGENHLAMRGRGPAGYNDLVRRTLVKFVDPEKRIALPPLKPGVGW